MDILKFFTPSMILMFLPTMLLQLGNYFKNKDANDTGTDDAAGNLLIALAPAVMALDTKNENSFRKALTIARDTINNYLDLPTTVKS